MTLNSNVIRSQFLAIALSSVVSTLLVLTVTEREPHASAKCHGFVAKCLGDKIVAGSARFLVEENVAERETQAILAAIAGLAWLTFAEHPNAKNLRAALMDTLPFA